jgi:putative redox protein
MKAKIKWQGGLSFSGVAGSGHSVLMDASPEAGGNNTGARPMELVLIGTGGCTSIDVMMMLKKSRQEISGCVVEITAERANEDPKVFTAIHFHFIITGKNVQAQHVERAINLSAEKYCSASIMLGKTAKMTHDFEIVEG